MKSRPPSSYGLRARLGLIVPPTNTVNEAEWSLMLGPPTAVSFHVTRMALHPDTSSEAGRTALHADLAQAVRDLAAATPDVIAYGCTAGSMVSPLDGLTDLMQGFAGIPCVATAAALVYAARALDMQKVAVATPYGDVLNRHEADYLAMHGLEVVNIQGLGIGTGGAHEYVRIARLSEAEVMAHCVATWRAEADGMIVSCTDLPTLRLLPRLEALFGKPVISSNLATLWHALRLAGIPQALLSQGSAGLLDLRQGPLMLGQQ